MVIAAAKSLAALRRITSRQRHCDAAGAAVVERNAAILVPCIRDYPPPVRLSAALSECLLDRLIENGR